ncbi:MAG: hypothetical protein JWO71_2302 [Candidatus Acidoferrum typicum]|nr:hypothetical protein [Candidatus Acidoferrum typicum]
MAPTIVCPYCSVTNQKSANGRFDPSQSEFLTDPKPFALDERKVELRVIARVLSRSPLIIEVLDTEPWGSYEFDNCGIRVIRSIDAKLKTTIANLQYNEFIEAKMFFGGDFGSLKLVLSDVTVTPGRPVYFHPEAGKDTCANRTGVLIVYRGRGAQLVIVHNDGSLYYRGVMFKSFHRQKLSGEELGDLLKLFARTGFDALPSSVPAMEKSEGPSVTLICSRFQDVPLAGHEVALAPLIERLEQLKTKALSQTYYLLTYKDKREIHLIPWPYHQIPLAQLEEYKHLAGLQRSFGKASGRDGDYSAVYQKLPQEFIERLPGTFALKKPIDPNRDVYFSDGGKVFRVEYNSACTNENPNCSGFDSLRAGDVASPDAALNSRKEDFENPAGVAFYNGFVGAWLWPTDISFQLAELPREGRVIGAEEFERHKLFYFELLLSGGLTCTGGVDFLEGGYKYEKVSVCQSDVPSQ